MGEATSPLTDAGCSLPMARRPCRRRCWLATFCGSLAFWIGLAADPLPQQVEHPFRNLAAWLREVQQYGDFHVVLLLRRICTRQQQ